MTALDPSSPVGVVGTGTMGQGIAQVALVAGHPVRLHDAAPGRAREAAAAIGSRLDRVVEKGRLAPGDRDAALARLHPAGTLTELADCSLVVEAVLERLDVKQELFRALEDVVGADCLLATNTSSLSVTAVGGALRDASRLVGLHFFNPAPLMPLVEVVSGFATGAAVATRAYETARAWGKTPVACADQPGFVVNRMARPFYAEAFELYETGVADPATIDAVLRGSGGFRMGPFELTDLIGQDVNEAVTRSVWESFFQDPRFRPSLAQRRLVESGRLGRKSGHGWYSYAQGAERPEPHTAPKGRTPAHVTVVGELGPAADLVALFGEAGIEVRHRDAVHPEEPGHIELPGGGTLSLTDGETVGGISESVRFDLALDYGKATRIALAAGPHTSPEVLAEATGLFQGLGKDVSVIRDVPGMIVARTVARIIDLAYDAVARDVACAEDVDTAMRLGVNYPLGPFEWNRRLPRDYAYCLLTAIQARDPGGRCVPSLALRRYAFHPRAWEDAS